MLLVLKYFVLSVCFIYWFCAFFPVGRLGMYITQKYSILYMPTMVVTFAVVLLWVLPQKPTFSWLSISIAGAFLIMFMAFIGPALLGYIFGLFFRPRK